VQSFVEKWKTPLKTEVRALIPKSRSINFDLECFNESLARRVIELSEMSVKCFKEKEFLDSFTYSEVYHRDAGCSVSTKKGVNW